MLIPVVFAPGRARERTNPAPTIIRNRHDGNASSCRLHGPNCGVPATQNRIRTGAYEISDDGWKLIVSRVKASSINGKTLPLDVSVLPQLVEHRSPSGFR
jgi:hypothetical protein